MGEECIEVQLCEKGEEIVVHRVIRIVTLPREEEKRRLIVVFLTTNAGDIFNHLRYMYQTVNYIRNQ